MSIPDLHELVDTGAVDTDILRAATHACGQVRLGGCREKVNRAIDSLELAHTLEREANEKKRQARDAFASALTEASWEVETTELVHDAGKTYIDVDDGQGGSTRQLVTSAERPAWVKRQAMKKASVVAAAEGLRRAEVAAEEASQGVRLAERRIDAAHWDLEGAMAALGVLRLAITTNRSS